MDTWKMYKAGKTVFEGSLDDVFLYARKISNNLTVEVDISKKLIIIVSQVNKFDKKNSIRMTVNKKLDEEKRKSRYYVDDPNYKFCYHCKRSKVLGKFGHRKNSVDCLATNCRDCVAAKARERYRKRRGNDL